MLKGLSVPLLVPVLVVAAAAGLPAAPPIDEWLLEQVKILSAPAMEGRRSGTPGGAFAARHVAGVFKAAGLSPGGDRGEYFQTFTVPTDIRLGARNDAGIVAPFARAWAVGRDFTPLAVSDNGSATLDLVFAGYGITAPDLRYDDYAGVDVRGKAVLVLTGEPRGRDPASPFRRPDAYHYSERRHKIINAREHGARAVLLVAHPAAADDLPPLGGVTQPWGILASAVTRAAVDLLLQPSGATVRDRADEIDRAFAPRSAPLAGVRIRLEIDLVRGRGTAENVIGIVPGTSPQLAEEAIVVGAHYDHLGRGGEGSLAPDQAGAIHPGADDNASGTAVVMSLARVFAATREPRTLVFVAFAGEEMGLLGSQEYVRRPAMPLEKTIAMVNLDMVGRLRDKLYVSGVDSGTTLRSLVTDAARGPGVSLELRGDPFAPSDHTSFYTAGRPVLFFFTGAHEQYHRPDDTWQHINAAGMVKVMQVAQRVVTALASASVPPAYVKLDAPSGGGRTGGGYGPFFGVVPDFGGNESPGVRISGVRAGSPAEKAGLQGGDVILAFAGVTVKTLDDLTFALRGRRAGDDVEVVFVRGGHEHRVRATLMERR
ncbi:MAG: aminopeptidase [Candidatus Rokuibacteriota bacterium]|nr:MAG: aminopeptidase [Candidatus Rokubacteria bacterium]